MESCLVRSVGFPLSRSWYRAREPPKVKDAREVSVIAGMDPKRAPSCAAPFSFGLLGGTVLAPCVGVTESGERPPRFRGEILKEATLSVLAHDGPRLFDTELSTVSTQLSALEREYGTLRVRGGGEGLACTIVCPRATRCSM